MTSTRYGRSLNGTGLKRQVDFSELKIKFLISPVVTGSNKEKNRCRLIRKRKWSNIN